MSNQILNDPRAGWAMALCSGDCNSAWLLSDLWFLDGEIICDDCLHEADGPDDRLARAQPFIGPDKERIAELEAENARQKEALAEVREVYAGSEGIPVAGTCSEAYLIWLIEQMYSVAVEALNPTITGDE